MMVITLALLLLPVREHHAPVGALRPDNENDAAIFGVREHHAPVGVLSLPCFVFATDRATPT